MKIIILLLVLIVAPSHANDDSEQLAVPINTELDEHNKIFIKIRYILGAAFDIHIKKFTNDLKTTPNEFVAETKKIRLNIKLLESEAALLTDVELLDAGLLSDKIYVNMILSEINLCMAGMDNFYGCQQALISLKDRLWGKTFGTDWSNYPSLTTWDGFPGSMK